MICKDCYFYDICHSRIMAGCGSEEINCTKFKDKTCLVELPVGNAGGWTCLYTVEVKDK